MTDQAVLVAGTDIATAAKEGLQHLKLQNIAQGKHELMKADLGVQTLIPKIAKLLERYSGVQKYYEEEENDLSRKIGVAHTAEREAESQKSATMSRMVQYENELSQNQSYRQSAQNRYSEAERKREEKETAANVATGAAVVLGIFTLGLGAPAAGIGAAAAAAAAVSFSQDAKRAKNERDRYDSLIDDCNRKISECRSSLSSLSNQLSQHSSDKQRYTAQRDKLHREKGRLKEVIAFLEAAKTHWSHYSSEAKSCAQTTKETFEIVNKMEKEKEEEHYKLFDSQGSEIVFSSFEDAWDAFEKMNEEGKAYLFKVSFTCTRCNTSRDEFPQVHNNRLICEKCHSK